MRTPSIPENIKAIRHPGFRNIFEYAERGVNPFPDPACPNLWGTETLCGDWSGNLLVVLKDFAPTVDLEHRQDSRALYSHRPDFATNRNLVALLAAAGKEVDLHGARARSCGVMYISASFLLRDGNGRSGIDLPPSVLQASWPVIEFTLQYMQQLTDIVLCGREAFQTFVDNGQLAGDRLAIQSGRASIAWRRYRIHCTTHTQPTAINTRRDIHHPDWSGWQIATEDWLAIGRSLQNQTVALPDRPNPPINPTPYLEARARAEQMLCK